MSGRGVRNSELTRIPDGTLHLLSSRYEAMKIL